MSQNNIETMFSYMKQSLLENMGSNLYSFYTDETIAATSIEQLPIYATVLRNQSFRAFHWPNPHK